MPASDDVKRAFEVLPNVSNVRGADHSLEFVVQGDVANVLQQAIHYPVLTMTSHEPTLEEAFLSYYQALDSDRVEPE